MANICYNEERYNEAVRLYQTALQYEIAKKDCNYMIGISFSQLGAFKEALLFLMTAVKMDGDRGLGVQFQYGSVLCQLEMFDKTIKQLNRVPSIGSRHVDGIYNLDLATYMKNGNLDEAAAHFEQAISIDKKHLLSQHAPRTFKTVKEEE